MICMYVSCYVTLCYSRGSALCLSRAAVPQPTPGPAPGPGSYNLPSGFDNVTKTAVASSSFLSTAGRWCNGTRVHTYIPGPGIDSLYSIK